MYLKGLRARMLEPNHLTQYLETFVDITRSPTQQVRFDSPLIEFDLE